MSDFLLNGIASGSVAHKLMAARFDPNALRPYIGDDGKSYVTVIQNGKPTVLPLRNANATLRKDEWKMLDTAVIKAAQPRLRIIGDFRSRGLVFTLNGLSKTVLEHQTQSDISEADISMDGLREARADRPEYGLEAIPLPIIHKDYRISARQLDVSRNGGSPFDTTMAELAGRRVAEKAEKLFLGTAGSYTFGGGTLYGLLNSPARIPYTITAPTASGWGPGTLIKDILEMRNLSQDADHYGPWALYTSKDWDVYLDDDFSVNKGDNTLRDRIRMIEGIEDVRTSDYMTGFDLLLCELLPETARVVVGMDITTIQWEEKGGMEFFFKVMAIMVPQIRDDFYGNSGLVHGSVAP